MNFRPNKTNVIFFVGAFILSFLMLFLSPSISSDMFYLPALVVFVLLLGVFEGFLAYLFGSFLAKSSENAGVTGLNFKPNKNNVGLALFLLIINDAAVVLTIHSHLAVFYMVLSLVIGYIFGSFVPVEKVIR